MLAILAASLLGWFGTNSGVRAWLATASASERTRVTVMVSGAIVLAGLLSAALGVWLGGRLARPIDAVVVLADNFAEGQARLQPVVSGIPELDRVSTAIIGGSQRNSRNLAAERDFASDASHQLRTPLTALLMRLEEIAETDDLQVVRDEAGIAIAQVERLTRVVDDLLGRNRRRDAPPPVVSLDSVIAALQREYQPAFERRRRSVRVDGERGLQVKATPTDLAQILSTLLENSLAHGGGTVELTARRSGPSVVLEVSDNGAGIDPTVAPHIFQRAVSTGRVGSSTGLGLALARDLAEANGGRLDPTSARPPTFALFLSEGGSD